MNPRLKALLALLGSLLVFLFGTTVSHNTTTTVTKTKTVATVPTAPPGDLSPPAPDSSKDATGQKPADSDLRDETPAGIPTDQLRQSRLESDLKAEQAGVSAEALPVAGAQGYSVRQDFSGHVYSDFLAGVTPSMFCDHYTVSSNITGWGDVLSIRDFFKRNRSASATFIADLEGHILQMVPLDHKAWTQGAFNPYCRASVEIIATGTETRTQWLAAPLIKRGILAALMRDVMNRYRIPLRFVDPNGCTAVPGWTDHNHIECSNDHLDLSPTCAFGNANIGRPLYPAYAPAGCSGFPFDVLKKQLAEKPKPPCNTRCRRVKQLRAKHQRTHARFRKNHCSRRGPHGHRRQGYCHTLRERNAAVHRAAHREHVSLKGTYR